MGGKPIPHPSFLDQCELLGIRQGSKLWANKKRTLYYEWDSLHGEIEAYNKRGKHIAVLDAVTGLTIKPAQKGRKIDVS